MALMGYREYARHRKVTLRAVQKAIEAKRITLVTVDGKPKIDSDQADRDWRDNTDPGARSLSFSAGPQAPASDVPDADAAGDDSGSDSELREVRIETMRIKRDLDRLALQKELREVVSLAEVVRLRYTEFRALRDALGNLATRTAPMLAVESDSIACERIVQTALDEVLNTFADQVMSRDAMQDGDDDDDEAD